MHSFASFPVGDLLSKSRLDTFIENIKSTSWKRKAYTNTDILIIDEASMIQADLFDALNISMKKLRGPENEHLPFGGLQLILSGDFYQLPPISKTARNDDLLILQPRKKKKNGAYSFLGMTATLGQGSEKETEPKYIFETESWDELIEQGMITTELKTVYRQTDADFIDILDEMRQGTCSPSTWNFLNGFRNKTWPRDGIMVRF